ncbi:MAG: hypothetical protein ACK53L_20250 [Pirellulaceae bacterium]
MEILDRKLPVMVFPVHLQRSAVVAIVDCPDRGQFIGSLSLKQVALQWIWLFQEFLIMVMQQNQSSSLLRPGQPIFSWT